MNNTISQLWNGNIEPIQEFGCRNTEMRRSETLMLKVFERLETSLGGENLSLLKKYSDCVNEYLMLSVEQAFSDGFCLGTKIISEALAEANEMLKK